MFRFGSIALGLLLAGYGAYLRWLEEPMSSEPAATSIEGVVHLASAGHGPHFVDFPGTVDMSRKLYRTGIAAPAYAACDPRLTHPLDGDWARLVGCTVTLPEAPTEEVAAIVTSRRDVELPPAAALRRRTVLARAQTGLWVLSRSFVHHPDAEDPAGASFRTDFVRGPLFSMADVTAEETAWIRTEATEGPLVRFSDLPEIRDDFDHGEGESVFLEGLQLAMGSVDAESTYVVLADGRKPIERPARASLPRVIAPVQEANNLFVALNWDEELDPSARLTGVVERLGAVPGASVMRFQTPDDVNAEKVSTANTAMVVGAAAIVFGLILIGLDKLLMQAGREMRRARARR